MSIGNVKTTGSKGNNWPWQYAMIKTLTAISTSLGASTEFESRLVRLIASPYTLYLEVRLWDVDSNSWSGTPKYYLVGSNTPVTPPSAVAYADEDNALILDAIKTACETTATETTSIDTNTASILAKNTEIETTANAIETSNAAILLDTAAIDTATAAINTNTATLGVTTNTAFMVRGTGPVTVTATVKSISVYNAHASAPGTITIGGGAAANLLAGETVNFDAGGNGNKFPASHFVVNGGGTADMLIIYTY
jgi:hypothetical protein